MGCYKIKGPEGTEMVTTARNEGGLVLVDETNLALGTYYYPGTDGRALGDFDFISVQFYLDGATLTLEVPVQRFAPFTHWVDVTPAGYSLSDDDTSMNPYTSSSGSPISKVVDWERLWTGRYRIKIQPTAATNRIIVCVEERFV